MAEQQQIDQAGSQPIKTTKPESFSFGAVVLLFILTLMAWGFGGVIMDNRETIVELLCGLVVRWGLTSTFGVGCMREALGWMAMQARPTAYIKELEEFRDSVMSGNHPVQQEAMSAILTMLEAVERDVADLKRGKGMLSEQTPPSTVQIGNSIMERIGRIGETQVSAVHFPGAVIASLGVSCEQNL